VKLAHCINEVEDAEEVEEAEGEEPAADVYGLDGLFGGVK